MPGPKSRWHIPLFRDLKVLPNLLSHFINPVSLGLRFSVCQVLDVTLQTGETPPGFMVRKYLCRNEGF